MKETNKQTNTHRNKQYDSPNNSIHIIIYENCINNWKINDILPSYQFQTLWIDKMQLMTNNLFTFFTCHIS